MYSVDIYRTINYSVKQLSGSNINDEQIAIVNNLSRLLYYLLGVGTIF